MSIIEIIIIIVLSVFQSIFGVGLLIIGTPIFLQLGYDFFSVLNTLLPFSIIISFLQFITDKFDNFDFKRNFTFISVPFLIASLSVLRYFYNEIDIIAIVALVMIVFSIINILPMLFKRGEFINNNQQRIRIIIGIILIVFSSVKP